MHTPAMSRIQRQAILLKLLRQAPLRTQSAAVEILAAEGIPTTQATLSRDFVSLGVIKTSSGYQIPSLADRNAATTGSGGFFTTSIQQVEVGETIIVIRTPPAHANAVAIQIDEISDPDLLGTIAGDDTVFVATRSSGAAKRLAATLFGQEPPSERS